ncbi:MAG: polysaccharide biosynthesis/export family protein, partial [Flavihumibacter sp.]|nr:polysaccharide biosynthesis/export family protein [Flavihumibacter sp.]
MNLKLLSLCFFVTLILFLAGCGATLKNHQRRLILQGADSISGISIEDPTLLIKKNDLLSIVIHSDNQEATEIYNQNMGATTSVGSGGANNLLLMGRGYQVDEAGMIYLHTIGLIKAEGKTKAVLAREIRDLLIPYLKQPYVTVRFANHRLTILGEVMKPGMIEMPDQKISILDAIGLAGDLTQFGRRDNVLVVREVDGKKVTGRINIGNASLYQSPYYYLQQNDLVYIEPNRNKPTGNEQVLSRNLTIITS